MITVLKDARRPIDAARKIASPNLWIIEMQHRGRKSAAELAALVARPNPPRLEPPQSLSDPEAALFREIVDACAPKHFAPSDLPLLVSFIQATLLARQASQDAASDAAALKRWGEAVKIQATLATRLRLAPQSRIDARAAARSTPPGPKRRLPWED